MKQFKLLTILLLTLVLTYSCTDSGDTDPVIPLGDYEEGYYITNEGPFQNGSGTLTFVGDDDTITQNVYKKVNNEDLGSVVQSMSLHNDFAYIVVNNAHKIVVANRCTMKKVAIIEGSDIKNPRYFVAVGNTGYVSNWGDAIDATDDYIAVIDLATNTVTKKIPVGEGPEKMLVDGNSIYVILKGGYSQNDKVEVISTSDNSVSTTLTIGDVPNSIVKDASGAIWILCGGKPTPWAGVTFTESNGRLAKIVNSTVTFMDFGTIQTFEHPQHLTINGNNLYYVLNGKVYQMSTAATELPSTEVSGLDGFYYSLKAHDGKLFATNAGNFASEGSLKIFNLSDSSLEKTITTGLIPGSVVFQ